MDGNGICPLSNIVAYGSLADKRERGWNVRFSNRSVGVKRFQTIRHCDVDVAHELALLFGFDTKALPSWDSKTTWNIGL
jgi:hypothetical protein